MLARNTWLSWRARTAGDTNSARSACVSGAAHSGHVGCAQLPSAMEAVMDARTHEAHVFMAWVHAAVTLARGSDVALSGE